MNTDDLKWILDRNSESIRDADNKAAIVLAVIAVIATILFSSDAFCKCAQDAFIAKDAAGIVLLVSMLLAALACVACSCLTIFPRTKSHKRSLIYFGDIASIGNAADYKTLISADIFSLNDEIMDQVVEVSVICASKMKWLARSEKVLAFLVIVLVLFICKTLLGSE